MGPRKRHGPSSRRRRAPLVRQSGDGVRRSRNAVSQCPRCPSLPKPRVPVIPNRTHLPKDSIMRSSFLPYCLPSIGEEEIAEVAESLRSGWVTTGPKVKRFEQEFADYVGAKHALAVNSCTAALHTSLAALDVGPGDEVIVPTLTFCATANVVVHL